MHATSLHLAVRGTCAFRAIANLKNWSRAVRVLSAPEVNFIPVNVSFCCAMTASDEPNSFFWFHDGDDVEKTQAIRGRRGSPSLLHQ